MYATGHLRYYEDSPSLQALQWLQELDFELNFEMLLSYIFTRFNVYTPGFCVIKENQNC